MSGVNKQVIRVMNGAGAAVAGQVPCHLIELHTKVREYFTITEKAWLKVPMY